jgi:hypothetical protein
MSIRNCAPDSRAVVELVDDLPAARRRRHGNAGPEHGQGGKYLFLPPGHDGEGPDGYSVFHSPTYSNWVVIRLPRRPRCAAGHQDVPAHPSGRCARDRVGELRGSLVQRHPRQDFSLFEETNEIVYEEPKAASIPNAPAN